jgi:hypothetical protein
MIVLPERTAATRAAQRRIQFPEHVFRISRRGRQTSAATITVDLNQLKDGATDGPSPRRPIVGYLWEILRYVAAWGGTGLIIWFWYWLFSNIGTF